LIFAVYPPDRVSKD
jgi:hypothetical protein